MNKKSNSSFLKLKTECRYGFKKNKIGPTNYLKAISELDRLKIEADRYIDRQAHQQYLF